MRGGASLGWYMTSLLVPEEFRGHSAVMSAENSGVYASDRTYDYNYGNFP